MSEIILASASPRRRELLRNMGLDFSIIVSDADEDMVDTTVPPEIYVQELALLKATATAKRVLDRKNALIISADTVVVYDNKILGKPKDEAEAKAMLKMLSGKIHQVYTGFCVLRMKDAMTVCKSVCTHVRFKNLTDEKISSYVATKECMDKAGAYGIQGLGSMLIDAIQGDYFNVVGLPVSELAEILETEFNLQIM